jgi:hypothetical protein
MYASLFGISGALHLAVFEQPVQEVFFSTLLYHQKRAIRRHQHSYKKTQETVMALPQALWDNEVEPSPAPERCQVPERLRINFSGHFSVTLSSPSK